MPKGEQSFNLKTTTSQDSQPTMGDLLKLARIPPPRARFCCDSACFSASESAFRQVVAKHDGVFGADKFLKFLQYALRASETPILRRSGRQGRRALGGRFQIRFGRPFVSALLRYLRRSGTLTRWRTRNVAGHEQIGEHNQHG